MIPTWLQRTRRGEPGRAATLRLCPRCKAPIITGLDADRAARTVKCDPTPLTELGEAIATITGRTTYDLVPAQGRKELCPREAHHITRPRQYPVLATHKCHTPMAPFAEPQPQKRKVIADDTPPF